MSIAIALKTLDATYIGADKQRTSYGMGFNDYNKICYYKRDNSVVGGVGYCRDLDIISIATEWKDLEDIVDNVSVDRPYVIKKIVPKFFKLMKDNNRLSTSEGIESMESYFLLAIDDKLFEIACDGATIEHNIYATIGCGFKLVTGYLETIKEDIPLLNEEEALQVMKTAIQISCEKDIGISQEFDFITLKHSELNKTNLLFG